MRRYFINYDSEVIIWRPIISSVKSFQERIREDRKRHWVNPCAFADENAIRRRRDHEEANLWRPAFVRDTERILHNPYYNRYSDKTQVLSAYRNDDISRRALHVQLVSRIARNIGRGLGLNTDLIEAVSLGHDIGHTPFGHAGSVFSMRYITATRGAILITTCRVSGFWTSWCAGISAFRYWTVSSATTERWRCRNIGRCL